MTEDLWTIEELSERVADALAVGYPGQHSGRVRDVPDRRTIRWYTTTGLVDRPAGMRGRTAVYGRRHLLQLVAIKRLQTEGLPLAEIQARLLGSTDGELEAVAALAEGTPAEGTPAEGMVPTPVPTDRAPRPPGADRARFWTAQPPPPATAFYAQPPADDGSEASRLVHGVRLRNDVTLLLDGRAPDPAETAALMSAAAPLLHALDRLGLGMGRPAQPGPGSPPPTEPTTEPPHEPIAGTRTAPRPAPRGTP